MVHDMPPGGSVIMITTASVRAIFEGHAAYAGAKAGTEHLVQAFAYEHGRRGIRVNAIAPGLTQTEMTAEFLSIPGMREAFEAEYPLGRLGTVEDVAAAAAFLASDECFMTGQILQINGGLTLRRNPTPAEIQASIAAVRQKSVHQS
jgi:NAD(P)-dependent dehydrogenase (short-subunit alcohol dehydrogenase family)